MLRKHLKPVYVFSSKKVESGYVGTKNEWVVSGTIYASVQSASNKATSEIYGERVNNMFLLICGMSDKVDESNRIGFKIGGKAEYKVVSVMRYNTHKNVLVEVLT